jgi:hypothetical protein
VLNEEREALPLGHRFQVDLLLNATGQGGV